VNTVVIGAGLSGLTAARRLQAAGQDVVVLEATTFVGGRTRSVRDRLLHGQPADLGASFVDLGQDLIIQVCNELGIELTPRLSLFPRDPDGTFTGASMLRNHVILDGQALDAETRVRIADESSAALGATPPGPVETVAAWTRRAGLSPLASRAFLAQTGLNPVHIPPGVQMSHIDPPETGKLAWMIADGTDTVATVIAEGLDVRLAQPVRLVSRVNGSVSVETDDDSFICDDVVVAVPVTPTLRIAFDPVLPQWKLDALLATPMAQGGKVVVQYSHGSLLAERLATGALSDGPVGFLWARPIGPEDTVVVLGLLPDRADGALRDEERVLRAVDDMVRAVAGDEPRRLAGVLQDWTSEEFTGGVVSMLTADYAHLTALLAQAVGPVHFAGEHTADTWATGMEGALRSGLRVADEILIRRARAGRSALPAA
jgi:monoamine oxidase